MFASQFAFYSMFTSIWPNSLIEDWHDANPKYSYHKDYTVTRNREGKEIKPKKTPPKPRSHSRLPSNALSNSIPKPVSRI